MGAAVGAIAGGVGAAWNPGNFVENGVSALKANIGSALRYFKVSSSTISKLAPFDTSSVILLSLTTANFIYNNVSQSCGEAKEYDWKKGQCVPKQIEISTTFPFPSL